MITIFRSSIKNKHCWLTQHHDTFVSANNSLENSATELDFKHLFIRILSRLLSYQFSYFMISSWNDAKILRYLILWWRIKSDISELLLHSDYSTESFTRKRKENIIFSMLVSYSLETMKQYTICLLCWQLNLDLCDIENSIS